LPAIQQALVLLRKGVPVLAKQLPKLWPLLLESKNRDKVGSLLRDLASASPTRKLAARMDLTEMLARRLVEQATTDEERTRAATWESHARKLRARLDMPVEGVKARRAHRQALHRDLGVLHTQMSEALAIDA
jgi:hypothetical protein